MPKLYYMIGIPGSGKTTWAEKFCEKTGAVYCGSDRIRNEVFGGYNRNQNAEVFKILNNKVLDKLQSGYDVVYDTVGLVQYWEDILNLYKPFAECIAVYVDTPFSIAVSRNEQRERPVPRDFIDFASVATWVPDKDDGFDDVMIVSGVKA